MLCAMFESIYLRFFQCPSPIYKYSHPFWYRCTATRKINANLNWTHRSEGNRTLKKEHELKIIKNEYPLQYSTYATRRICFDKFIHF